MVEAPASIKEIVLRNTQRYDAAQCSGFPALPQWQLPAAVQNRQVAERMPPSNSSSSRTSCCVITVSSS